MTDSPQNGSPLYRAILARVKSDLVQAYHDINNPLAVISGNIQLLEQLLVMQDTDPGILEVVDDIRIACDKMAKSSAKIDVLRMELSSILENGTDADEAEETDR